MRFENWLQTIHPEIPTQSALATVRLAEEGATIPFIARYRKEQTGNLDEVGIQNVVTAKERWDQVLKRQEFIVSEIENQGKLTPELKERILSTFKLELLEDLYLPFKLKKKSKATLAKEAGLEPLADWIWNCGHGTESPQPGQTLELWAFTFRNEEKGFNEASDAIQGATDILIERLSEKQDLRAMVRENVMTRGTLRSEKAEKAKPNSKFEKYFDNRELISSLLLPQNSHRYLAIRRGWIEEELKLSVTGNTEDVDFEERMLKAFETEACTVPDSVGAPTLQKAAKLAFKVHVLPSIENEAHKALKEIADQIAIKVFAENVRKLLLASPFGSKCVLGVDPGIRTGCKLALIDDSGKFLATNVIYLKSEPEKESAKKILSEIFTTVPLKAVAVGNGTAGRETEIFLRQVIKELNLSIPVVMVNEAGASVYSASEAAREEFPDLDVTVRGAISIARRLQDPLAELVKIEPKSIGVGQYQHDVNPHALKKSLDWVVDSCVNSVGVNLNTASYHLLAHVSGIGPTLAKNIVTHRVEKGLFKNRRQLLDVSRFSTKAFEQSAGFLRIADGEYPLDNTGVHPERYEILETFAKKVGKEVKDFVGTGASVVKSDPNLANEIGQFTFQDIVNELEKPGRDPRESFIPFQYRDDIFELKDLKPGMTAPGIVTNVTNFGAFVDIGVHQDGLVHLSQLSDRFVKDPNEIVSPGDRVNVRVLEINLEKNQISLSMKSERPVQAQRPQHQHRERHSGGGDRRPQKDFRPQKPKRPQFSSNPFAALAALKDNNDKKSQ